MSVASLNLYHHGKHHIHPVPKWMVRLFFIIIPKLLFMNIDLPAHYQKRQKSKKPLKCNNLLHNGTITINEISNKTSPLVLRPCTPKQDIQKIE